MSLSRVLCGFVLLACSLAAPAALAQDLSILQTAAPYSGTTASAGQTFTARVQVLWQGTATLTTAFQVSFHYCPTAAATGCTLLGNASVAPPQSPGQTKYVVSPNLVVPAAAVMGNAYLRFQLDSTNAVPESNENNNNAYHQITVTATPDLTITAAQVPFSGAVDKPGATFTARHTIQAVANRSAVTTNFYLAHYFCPGASPTGCTSLGDSQVTTDLPSGGTAQVQSATLTVPASATPGTYYVRAFVDSTGLVSEASETNNNYYTQVTVVGTPTDLQVKSFTATVVGSSVTYAAEVCNAGAATTKSLTLALTFHAAAAPSCGASSDRVWTLTSGLAQGACETRSHVVPSVSPGSYTAWFFADATCVVAESTESNNLASAAYTVAPPPDGGPVDLAVPSDGSAGDAAGDAPGAGDGAREAAAGSDAAWRWPDGARRDGGRSSWPALDPNPQPAEVGCGCALGRAADQQAPRFALVLGLFALVLFGSRRRR